MLRIAIRLCVLSAICALVMLVCSTAAQADTKDRIMREARSMAGRDYNNPTFNCSDYTRLVFGRTPGVHVWMPDWDDAQLDYGRHPANMKRGDLVFFREHKGDGPVTHVGIFAGGGYLWHNSVYYGEVVKSPMVYVDGFKPGYTRRIR